MQVLYRWFWKWGDSSTIVYDLNRPGSRDDLRRVIQRIKDKQESPDITHHEFFEVKSISMDNILKAINDYPTHDPS